MRNKMATASMTVTERENAMQPYPRRLRRREWFCWKIRAYCPFLRRCILSRCFEAAQDEPSKAAQAPEM